MSTVIFTSSSLRHKAFAAIINNNPKLKILKIFHEEGAPLNELIKNKPDSKIELDHLEARTLAENDFFKLFIDTQEVSYFLGTENFVAITKYNYSHFYAMVVLN